MVKTAQMRLIELERGSDLATLIEEGVNRGWTLAEIARDFGVSRNTVVAWGEQLGMKIVRRREIVRSGGLVGSGR